MLQATSSYLDCVIEMSNRWKPWNNHFYVTSHQRASIALTTVQIASQDCRVTPETRNPFLVPSDKQIRGQPSANTGHFSAVAPFTSPNIISGLSLSIT